MGTFYMLSILGDKKFLKFFVHHKDAVDTAQLYFASTNGIRTLTMDSGVHVVYRRNSDGTDSLVATVYPVQLHYNILPPERF